MLKRFRVAQQFVPERDFELVAENPEIVKIAPNGNDVTFSFSTFVCGREPRHDAIRVTTCSMLRSSIMLVAVVRTVSSSTHLPLTCVCAVRKETKSE